MLRSRIECRRWFARAASVLAGVAVAFTAVPVSSADTLAEVAPSYRGWVAYGHARLMTSDEEHPTVIEDVTSGWWADTEVTNSGSQGHSAAVGHQSDYEYFRVWQGCDPNKWQQTENAGSASDDGVTYVEAGDPDDVAVPFANGTPTITFRRTDFDATVFTPGVAWYCSDPLPLPSDTGVAIAFSNHRLPARANPASPPLTITERQQYSPVAGETITYQVCMTRDARDSDADGLPDAVDLAPSSPAPATQLGRPGGPARTPIPAKLPNGPSGVYGVPACPADAQPPMCSNGVDDDHDGLIDFGSGRDPGCASDADTSELGSTACDNGVDDDGDGFIDVGGGDPNCQGPHDDDEAAAIVTPTPTPTPSPTPTPAACEPGEMSKEWVGGTTVDSVFATVGDYDGAYGLHVKWCRPPGGPADVEVAEVLLDKSLRLSSFLGPLGKTIQKYFGIGFEVKWKPASRQTARTNTLPGNTVRVTASTGQFDVCANLVGVSRVLGLGPKAFKRLPLRTRKKLIGKVIGEPSRKAVRRYFNNQNKKYKREYLERLQANPRERIVPTDDLGKTVNQRAKQLANETERARAKAVTSLVNLVVDSLVDMKFSEVCVRAWKPTAVVTIPASGEASITENGPASFALWRVSERTR